MKRLLTSMLLFAVLNGVVSAQTRRSASPPELAKLFARNRGMLDDLVSGSIRLSGTSDALRRTESYTPVLKSLSSEMQRAIDDGDAIRAAELGRHLTSLFDRAVTPVLTSARQRIPNGSQDESKLFRLRDQSTDLLATIEKSIRDGEEKKSSPELRMLLKSLESSAAKVRKAGGG